MRRMTNDILLASLTLAGLAAGCGSNEVGACYSPTANVSTADQPGAKGCACNSAVDQAVCVQGKALFCDYDRWSFGFDGPCMPVRDAGGSPDIMSTDLRDSGDGALTCGTPSCCVPSTIDPGRVYVYRKSDGGHISMVLTFEAAPASFWDMDVDVVLPSGTSVACTSSLRAATDSKTVSLYCPAVALDALPACDSTIKLELHPRSSTYSDSSGSQALCAGTADRQITLTVPVRCPDCGNPSNGSACSVLGQSCNYSTMAYGGNGGTPTVSLPCSCVWNDVLNGLAWSCAVP